MFSLNGTLKKMGRSGDRKQTIYWDDLNASLKEAFVKIK